MASAPDAAARVVGWDVGGAHLKACLLEAGRVVDAAQWPCPLWKGLAHLDEAIAAALARWPQAREAATRHAATMTGEMVDLFADREQGVARLAAALAEALGPSLRLYAGTSRFVAPHEAPLHWRAIASANWQATGALLARRAGDALLLDIGSTTTDVMALRGGRVAAQAWDDARRLACGELVYQGVVRTPLCALAPRVPFEGEQVNVMNEFFATTADVYRTTGELDPAHDQDATADGAGKGVPETSRRLARMIGRDARDRGQAAWLALALAWRTLQVADIESQVARVAADAGLPADAPVFGAGCGAFLVADIARRAGRRFGRFSDVIDGAPDVARAGWVDVCAPAVAVAALAFEQA
jgi:probable H4MPT-linked C1 transfer pathway protein